MRLMAVFWLNSRNEVGAERKPQRVGHEAAETRIRTLKPELPKGLQSDVSLTAAGLVVVVKGEVGGASADEAADRDGEAEVGAVSVGGGAGVPATLPG